VICPGAIAVHALAATPNAIVGAKGARGIRGTPNAVKQLSRVDAHVRHATRPFRRITETVVSGYSRFEMDA
jgi:hypothetical protein